MKRVIVHHTQLLILIVFTISCGDAAILKEPFRIQTIRLENNNAKPILHSQSTDICEVILEKRIYKILFLLPLNGFNPLDIQKLQSAKSIRYKKVIKLLDILYTSIGFLASFQSETIEIEDCQTNYLVVNPDQIPMPKEMEIDTTSIRENERLKLEISFLEKSMEEMKKLSIQEKSISSTQKSDEKVIEIPDLPILTGYHQYIQHNLNPKTQDYLVIFENNKIRINKDDLKKINKFAMEYKMKYSIYNILLIGHADWKGGINSNISISMERVKIVKNELMKLGIPENKIFTTASGSYWPGNNEEKSGREFHRRVDLLYME